MWRAGSWPAYATEAILNDLTACFGMPRSLTFATTAPAAVLDAGRELARRVRLARVRRRIALRKLASRAGISYDTVRAVEAANLLTGLGAYLALIWAPGLEREFAHLLNPDADIEGKQLELARMLERAGRRGISMPISRDRRGRGMNSVHSADKLMAWLPLHLGLRVPSVSSRN
jgi:transcriptional regulator with XRE-family HTH domain